eukprot:5547228-Prymnesium_polylepis.1
MVQGCKGHTETQRSARAPERGWRRKRPQRSPAEVDREHRVDLERGERVAERLRVLARERLEPGRLVCLDVVVGVAWRAVARHHHEERPALGAARKALLQTRRPVGLVA